MLCNTIVQNRINISLLTFLADPLVPGCDGRAWVGHPRGHGHLRGVGVPMGVGVGVGMGMCVGVVSVMSLREGEVQVPLDL